MWPHERREEQAHSMTKIQMTMSLSPDYPLHTTRASEFRRKGAARRKKKGEEEKKNVDRGVASDLGGVGERGNEEGKR